MVVSQLAEILTPTKSKYETAQRGHGKINMIIDRFCIQNPEAEAGRKRIENDINGYLTSNNPDYNTLIKELQEWVGSLGDTVDTTGALPKYRRILISQRHLANLHPEHVELLKDVCHVKNVTKWTREKIVDEFHIFLGNADDVQRVRELAASKGWRSVSAWLTEKLLEDVRKGREKEAKNNGV